MIYAIYRRAAADLSWSLACSADKKSVAQTLVKDVEKTLESHGYTQGEVKIEEYESDKDVKRTLD